MQYGFVLDQGACIGCHACTVACKAENDVPLGSFRTWVKWVESESFPETRRSAAVLRCNHCEHAPCISICPTGALHKRPDGIVDLDPRRCIGCASCLQACPYDAIYIDDREGTAAKCHFCAHRVENGVAPACVAVCPEQAIKVVDLDADGMVVELERRGAVSRKPERGTRPHTFYLEADPIALDPLQVDGARTMSHSEVPDPLPHPGNAAARAFYDVPRRRLWGWKIAAYMTTKAVAAGALLGAGLSPWWSALPTVALGWISLIALLVTTVLLIADLHRPERFLLLLTKPNTGSWLVKGAWVLMAHGALSLPWAFGLDSRLGSGLGSGSAWLPLALAIPSMLVALLTAAYTAFLFWQARGRELWSEDRWLPLVLSAQAVVSTIALAWVLGVAPGAWVLLYALVVAITALLPPSTPAARRAHHDMVRRTNWRVGLALAVVAAFFPPLVFAAFFLLDHAYIQAGQSVPLS